MARTRPVGIGQESIVFAEISRFDVDVLVVDLTESEELGIMRHPDLHSADAFRPIVDYDCVHSKRGVSATSMFHVVITEIQEVISG